jgi:hypothetical protein
MTLDQARAQGIVPKSGGTLTTFLTPEPPILINAINFQAPTFIVGSGIFQGLLKYSFDLRPLPQLYDPWPKLQDYNPHTVQELLDAAGLSRTHRAYCCRSNICRCRTARSGRGWRDKRRRPRGSRASNWCWNRPTRRAGRSASAPGTTRRGSTMSTGMATRP